MKSGPILLVADCGEATRDASRAAVDLARTTGAPLLVVAVAHTTFPAVGYSVTGYSAVAARMQRLREARACDALEAVEDAAGAELEGATVLTAEPSAAAIRELAVEHDASLIVVPAHSRPAQRLFESAPCPVLVVAAERVAA